ncbi:MAG: response regulator [Firmicutes bacterium]|nr:response regulator [Bacillota bacterium]
MMIAEDELLVRMGLSTSIPWSTLDMQVVAAESNGTSAWEAFCAHRPDIVLTDLRMPGIDGTELIRRIRKNDPGCEIIVITCLEEFAVLYQLMQMHITGYLLKATMSQTDIMNLLQQAKANLEGKKHSSVDGGASDESDELLRSFVFGHHDAARYCRECEQKGKTPEPFGGMLMVQLKSDDAKSLLLPTVQTMFLDKLSAFGIQSSILKEELLVFLLPGGADAAADLSAALLELARYSSDILNAKLRMAMFFSGPDGTGCGPLWEKGLKTLQDEFFYPEPLTVLRSTAPSAQKKLLKRIGAFQEQIELVPWKSPEKKETFLTRLQDLRSSFENKPAFLQVAAELAELYRFSFFGEQLPGQEEIRGGLEGSQSAQSALEYLSALLFPAQPGGHCSYSEKIFETMRYIREHAEDSISLSSLANMVALSPNYYASLFKQTAGCSFSEYIGNVRMEKACTLLSTTELSVMEIAERCGYSDMTYFIRFFKQKMGKPPRRWRKEE